MIINKKKMIFRIKICRFIIVVLSILNVLSLGRIVRIAGFFTWIENLCENILTVDLNK